MKRDNHHARSALRRRRSFTLVEMLVTLLVIATVFLVLCRLFANMQQAWTVSNSTTGLYEDARIALDVVTRDLKAAMAARDDIPGQHICFHQPGNGALWFVTVTDADATATCHLAEIGYRLADNRFERAFVDQSHAAWNVYGERDDADDQDGYQRVIDGVLELSFTCYGTDMQQIMPLQASILPRMVTLKMTLLDPRSFKLWQQMPAEQKAELEKKAARTFRKTVFLGLVETGV